MENSINNQFGKTRNTLNSYNSEVGTALSLNAIVSSHSLTVGLSEMITKHISRHLSVWCKSISGAAFRISKIGEIIYLDTNSLELLNLYLQYEQPFVEYMIEEELQAAEEAYMWLGVAA